MWVCSMQHKCLNFLLRGLLWNLTLTLSTRGLCTLTALRQTRYLFCDAIKHPIISHIGVSGSTLLNETEGIFVRRIVTKRCISAWRNNKKFCSISYLFTRRVNSLTANYKATLLQGNKSHKRKARIKKKERERERITINFN